MRITLSNAHEVDTGVWRVPLPPHQAKLFGRCESHDGQRSVVLLGSAQFQSRSGELSFDVDNATSLNIGRTSDALLILADNESGEVAVSVEDPASASKEPLSRGDREFLDLCRKEFHEPMYETAQKLLAGVRARSAGELKRGKSRNFSDTPDNFWYVIVQPRIQELSITVRGSVDHFSSVAQLPIKDDRGNTLFKVTGELDVEAALKIIFHAKRKN